MDELVTCICIFQKTNSHWNNAEPESSGNNELIYGLLLIVILSIQNREILLDDRQGIWELSGGSWLAFPSPVGRSMSNIFVFTWTISPGGTVVLEKSNGWTIVPPRLHKTRFVLLSPLTADCGLFLDLMQQMMSTTRSMRRSSPPTALPIIMIKDVLSLLSEPLSKWNRK